MFRLVGDASTVIKDLKILINILKSFVIIFYIFGSYNSTVNHTFLREPFEFASIRTYLKIIKGLNTRKIVNDLGKSGLSANFVLPRKDSIILTTISIFLSDKVKVNGLLTVYWKYDNLRKFEETKNEN